MNYFFEKRILIISTESWAHIPLSKHHYSITLATAGAKVYFLNPAGNKFRIEKIERNDNLLAVDHPFLRGSNLLPKFLRDLLNKYIIRKIERLAGGKFDIIWSFDPYRFQDLNLFGAEFKIYHPVDAHTTRLEMEVAQSSDLIISVSDLILNRFSAVKAAKQKINHGLQAHFVNQNYSHSYSGERLKVGYVGNLDNFCIDKQTLLQIVAENPEIEFQFIGPYPKDSDLAEKLRGYSHCTLTGRVPSSELPEYFKSINLFLMCYNGADKVVNSNHHKVLEFLSTGKPLVMNYTDEYKTRKDVVIMSENNSELPQLFKKVIANYADYLKPEVIAKRISLASSNTYQAHVKRIEQIAGEIVDLRK